MTGEFPANDFWDWSLVVYGRPGVSTACLALQERHGIDVNIVLFCCWTGARGQRLNRASLGRAAGDVEEWHRETVRPLRAIRKRLRAGLPPIPPDLAETVRRRIAAAELEAEHLEQIVLSRHMGEGSPADVGEPAESAASNLRLYAGLRAFDWSPDDLQPLRAILGGAFPECELPTVATLATAIVAAPPA